jgi:hypothetical protein
MRGCFSDSTFHLTRMFRSPCRDFSPGAHRQSGGRGLMNRDPSSIVMSRKGFPSSPGRAPNVRPALLTGPVLLEIEQPVGYSSWRELARPEFRADISGVIYSRPVNITARGTGISPGSLLRHNQRSSGYAPIGCKKVTTPHPISPNIKIITM